MKLLITTLLVIYLISTVTAFAFLNGAVSSQEDSEKNEELEADLSNESTDVKLLLKPYKPVKPHKPSILKPTIHKPSIHKPTIHKPTIHKPTIHKPTIHKPTIHKPIHKPTIHKPLKPTKPSKPTKPLKPHKPGKPTKPGKPCSFLPNLSLPQISLPSFPSLPTFNKLTLKIPADLSNKFANKIRATKTEYIEVTRRQVVHPICYITLKPKKPCIQKLKEHDNDEDATGLDDVTYNLGVEMENPEKSDLPVEPETDDSVAAKERRARYIEIIDAPTKVETSNDYDDVDYAVIEPSEDPEARFKLPSLQEAVTRTVLVTRIEKYTDTKVTATVIAKNCAPVNPHVPKCPKKHHNIIRVSPDSEIPVIAATVVKEVIAPTAVRFEPKKVNASEKAAPVEDENVPEVEEIDQSFEKSGDESESPLEQEGQTPEPDDTTEVERSVDIAEDGTEDESSVEEAEEEEEVGKIE